MRLRDWAARAYAARGAKALLLRLQDRHGQSACYLLWAAWAAAEGRPVDDALLTLAATRAEGWERIAVAPLRGIRRRAAKGSDLRDDFAELELDAELRLLDGLDLMTPSPGGEATTIGAALARAAAGWPTPAPPGELESLSHIFADLRSC